MRWRRTDKTKDIMTDENATWAVLGFFRDIVLVSMERTEEREEELADDGRGWDGGEQKE